MVYLPVNARSELVTPRNFSDGGVVDTSLRFHAAWPASHRPGDRPTRGSGLGVVADTVGVTGAGITAGGGVGGGGGFPRPRPPAPGASAVAAGAGGVAGAAAAFGAGADAAGCGVGGGVAGADAGAGGGIPTGAADFGAQATTSTPAAMAPRTNDLIYFTPSGPVLPEASSIFCIRWISVV